MGTARAQARPVTRWTLGMFQSLTVLPLSRSQHLVLRMKGDPVCWSSTKRLEKVCVQPRQQWPHWPACFHSELSASGEICMCWDPKYTRVASCSNQQMFATRKRYFFEVDQNSGLVLTTRIDLIIFINWSSTRKFNDQTRSFLQFVIVEFWSRWLQSTVLTISIRNFDKKVQFS